MATKAQVRTNILSLVSNSTMIASTDVDALLVADHREILDSYSWSRRKADTLITLAAPYSTGTISSSGATVTGASTVFTSAMTGRFIRAQDQNYFTRIATFTSATSIAVDQAFASDLSAGTKYNIFKHRYNLPSDWGRVLTVTGNVRLREVSRFDLDDWDPYRTATANPPEYFFIFGLDPGTTTSQLFQIELWPVPAAATQLRIAYLRSNDLSSDSDEPLYRSDVLVWKTAESSSFFLHGKTGDESWLQLSDRYHQRYLEALEGAKMDDLGKSSLPWHVKDALVQGVHGDDFYLNHDDIRLR